MTFDEQAAETPTESNETPEPIVAESLIARPEAVEPADVALAWPAEVVETIATDDPEVVAGAPGHSRLADAVESLGLALGKRIDALQVTFDREVRAEATREKVVDRLHAELQDYKNDLLLNLLRPIFIDLIQLHDDIGKIVAAQADSDDSTARLLTLMQGFQQGIEDILYRQGVEAFEVEGDSFDPRRQRALSTQTTDDPDLNKRIAARLRRGFRSSERVIRPEIVSVFSLKR